MATRPVKSFSIRASLLGTWSGYSSTIGFHNMSIGTTSFGRVSAKRQTRVLVTWG